MILQNTFQIVNASMIIASSLPFAIFTLVKKDIYETFP